MVIKSLHNGGSRDGFCRSSLEACSPLHRGSSSTMPTADFVNVQRPDRPPRHRRNQTMAKYPRPFCARPSYRNQLLSRLLDSPSRAGSACRSGDLGRARRPRWAVQDPRRCHWRETAATVGRVHLPTDRAAQTLPSWRYKRLPPAMKTATIRSTTRALASKVVSVLGALSWL